MISILSIKHKGNFDKTEIFFKRAITNDYLRSLEKLGHDGVTALASATPVDTGKTKDSWDYEIQRNGSSVKIVWSNSNVVDGVSVAVLIQYGHGTGNGGYVEGIDFINPALKPVFDKILSDLWREVTK